MTTQAPVTLDALVGDDGGTVLLEVTRPGTEPSRISMGEDTAKRLACRLMKAACNVQPMARCPDERHQEWLWWPVSLMLMTTAGRCNLCGWLIPGALEALRDQADGQPAQDTRLWLAWMLMGAWPR
jgi:hypothetical protein